MRRRNERITLLAVSGTLALNYPWLSLFSTEGSLFGIPSLYLYLFVVWSVFIALVRLLIDTEDRKKSGISPAVTEKRITKSPDA